MGIDVLGNFIKELTTTFTQGGQGLTSIAKNLLMLLLAIDFIVVSIMNIEHPDRIKVLAQQILKIGAWIFVVTNAYDWSKLILDSLNLAGNMIAPGGDSVIKNPTGILTLGMSKISAMWDKVFTLGADGPLDFVGKFLGVSGDKSLWENVKSLAGDAISPGGMFVKYLFGIVMYVLFFCLIVWALGVLTIQVVMAIVEFHLISAVAVILIPFGSFKWLSFVGEKAIGAIWSSGIKLMVMQIVAGIIMKSLESWQDPTKGGGDVTTNLIMNMAYMCILAFMYVTLAKEVPSLVSGLLSGSPNLSAGDVASTASSGASAAQNVTGAIGKTYDKLKKSI